MRLLEYSYDSPAENLALDEALLDEAEAGRGEEILRFWTSPAYFVVLGLSQAVDAHVLRDACEEDNVPIVRRCSAGGCVLQGPGCLNYSLVLRTDRAGCETIHSSYRTILGALSQALGTLGLAAAPAGISDLAIAGRKVSGSAQRRRRNFFLHHGTLLHGMDLKRCARYLREPADQPVYREQRDHLSFIANIEASEAHLVHTVSAAFHAQSNCALDALLYSSVSRLIRDKYSKHEWSFRK